MSDGHPYSSLIRSIAARSCSSSRMVVAVRRFFCVMPQYYHIDIHPVKCYIFFVGLGTLPRKRETVRLRVPSQWNIRWVPNKKPCSGKIFPVERNAPCLQVVRHGGQGRAPCQCAQWSGNTPMMCRALKLKLYSPLGYRVEVEHRHKPVPFYGTR